MAVLLNRDINTAKWGQPWIVDLLASVFVGFSLLYGYYGYAYLYSSFWMPVGVGYLVPVLVYRFSVFWNVCHFFIQRAAIISLVMGTLFTAVHHLMLPHWVGTSTGFVAPIIVSLWARGFLSNGKAVPEVVSE